MWGPMLGNDPKTREKMIEGVAAWLPLGFRLASAWLPLGFRLAVWAKLMA